ncbi:MAG TPA: hypothetical protein VHF46_02585 [Rubrobacteraceae bacterium]|nr:hypothetical protein [Rubrobacteraceae bacterium]
MAGDRQVPEEVNRGPGIQLSGLSVPPTAARYPARRREARSEFGEKTEGLRKRLGEVVGRQFDAEIERSIESMREAIVPYTRFVRTEHARMTEARSALTEITAEAESLRAEIRAPGVEPPS